MKPVRVQRWNSQSTKVQGLDPGFSRAFQVEGLDPGFLYAIHKHQAKISRFFIGYIFSYGFFSFSIIHSMLRIFIRIFVLTKVFPLYIWIFLCYVFHFLFVFKYWQHLYWTTYNSDVIIGDLGTYIHIYVYRCVKPRSSCYWPTAQFGN